MAGLIPTNELFYTPNALVLSSPPSSDSDQQYCMPTPFLPHISGMLTPERHTERTRVINEINQKLIKDEPVDLRSYPPLFVVDYRGVN